MVRGPRKWIKIFCYETLHGSVSYQLSEAEQSVWVKLLCFAGLCGNEGLIADHDLRPFPHPFIIHEIHTDEDIFKATLAKCKEEGRISEDGQGIRITNWAKYQSEYDRQKPWRERKKAMQGVDSEKFNQGRLQELVKQRTEQTVSEGGNGDEE